MDETDKIIDLIVNSDFLKDATQYANKRALKKFFKEIIGYDNASDLGRQLFDYVLEEVDWEDVYFYIRTT